MYEKPGRYKHWDFTLIDIVILELCYLLAFYIRHHSNIKYYMMRRFAGSSYAAMVILIILMVLISGLSFHNYSKILQRNAWKELASVFQHVTIVTAGLILYLFIVKDQGEFSRLVLGYFYVISIPVLLVVRVLYKALLRKKNTTGYNRRNAILLVSPDISKDRIRKLKKDFAGVVSIAGVCVDGKDAKGQTEYCGIPIYSAMEELSDKVRSQWVDEVFILMSDTEQEKWSGTLSELSIMGITMHYVVNSGIRGSSEKSVEKIGDTMLLTESIHTITFTQAVVKRIVDIIGALVGLVFTGIFTIIVGPMIYKADPGPIFYKQKRIGRNGRVFNMYKFRSMYQDADRRKAELMQKNEMNGLMFKMKDDPRILGSGEDGTKHGIGWFIRTTSIDEFPQFLNVLLGQLSLVGTRPPTVDEWNQYESHHRARMAVKPGITGLWQVSGRNKITDFEDVVKLDLEYISNFSLAEDVKILARTVKVVLKHEGAE